MGDVYVPPKHALDEDHAWQIVKDAGAGMLVVPTSKGLLSVFVPVVVSEDRQTLWSHLARANPWWKSVESGAEVLAIFLVASAYVSPTYYPSRLENPGVVPTWNYVAAEVRGRLTLHEETEWKLDQVRAVTSQFEEGRDPEWRVDDMDPTYRDQQLKAIVGIEIDVLSIEGKAKMSQNRPEIDQRSVKEHLGEGSLGEKNVAQRMNPPE
ncbi:MAG TPA: FMN-binding negative transcriptional regulator [Acidimicrobiales bacterium]|nr:FMN-binding negative transcriptional regulator [Acidimicrobiales bacterium]